MKYVGHAHDDIEAASVLVREIAGFDVMRVGNGPSDRDIEIGHLVAEWVTTFGIRNVKRCARNDE